MDINKKQIARVWETEKKENIITGFLSTYEGKKVDGEAKWHSWYTRFVGKAVKPASKLKSGDKIVLTNAKVENSYNKKKKEAFVSVTVFDFELPEDED